MKPYLSSDHVPSPGAVRLYGTSACHLREQAEQQLQTLEEAAVVQYCKVDIALDDALFERYGLTIPVVRNLDETELNWPFNIEELADFLGV